MCVSVKLERERVCVWECVREITIERMIEERKREKVFEKTYFPY